MKAKHAPCSCGCGEMADECMTGRNPLGAFEISGPVGSFGRMEGHHPTARKTPEGWDEPACTCPDPQCIPPGTRRAASHKQAVEWAAHILEGRAK